MNDENTDIITLFVIIVFDLSHSLKIWKQILKAEATYVCFLQEIVYISKEQTIRIINYFI